MSSDRDDRVDIIDLLISLLKDHEKKLDDLSYRLERLLEENQGKVSLVIMVDAALKLEGEKTGEVAEGIGAAIGGIGVEKFKIEEITLKYKVPLNAVIVRQSIQEAIAPMSKEISEGVDVALARVKQIIQERTNRGDSVIVAGIGNTIGIG